MKQLKEHTSNLDQCTNYIRGHKYMYQRIPQHAAGVIHMYNFTDSQCSRSSQVFLWGRDNWHATSEGTQHTLSTTCFFVIPEVNYTNSTLTIALYTLGWTLSSLWVMSFLSCLSFSVPCRLSSTSQSAFTLSPTSSALHLPAFSASLVASPSSAPQTLTQ